MALILMIDDEVAFARNCATFLTRAGHTVETAATLDEGLRRFDALQPDLVLLDHRLPDGTGTDGLRHIRTHDREVPVMLVTGHGSIELAVETMRAGADDLLTKPVPLPELRERVEAQLRRRREHTRLRWYEGREREAAHELLGDSEPMVQLRQRVDRIASVEVGGVLPPVLITGETGTGKELVARACHFRSARRDRPFVEINCAAIPANLLESELFGHERGAFTGAHERKIGLLEAADGGTLFLDEIGDMDLGLQAKLLKVLEDGRFRRVGAVQERQVALRLVAATNQDLDARVARGQFRADLLFRLRVLQLVLPPLRERPGDAVQLARQFAARFAQRYRREGVILDERAEIAIAAHPWPGNVRELRNVVEQAVLLAPLPRIGAADLMLSVPGPGTAGRGGAVAGDPPVEEAGGGSRLDRAERAMLADALAKARHNVSLAARELGISRDTLRYRMEKHGLRD